MPAWINEFHYDNASTDTGEFIEIAATAGTDLTGWTIVRYNGSTPGAAVPYTTSPGLITLSGVVSDQTGTGFGFVSVSLGTDGIQNGPNDGFALVNAQNQVVQFLSYEGVITAASGPAAGRTSTAIPSSVSETGTEPAGTSSIGLVGTGSQLGEFTWAKFDSAPATDLPTPGRANIGQTFVGQPAAEVSISDAQMVEGDAGEAFLVFTVSRTGGQQVFQLGFTTQDGTATAGGDYVGPVNGVVTFAQDQPTAEVRIAVRGDLAFEGTETFTVRLGAAPTGVRVADGEAVGTINDNEAAPPQIAVSDASVIEGDAGQTLATFTITRSGALGGEVTVSYATADGTASAGSDYAAAAGQVTFADGETSKTVTVAVNGDTAREQDETFSLALANPTGGAVIADAQGAGVIRNDEITFIHEVQGTAFFSPLLAAEGITQFNVASSASVLVEGVVTAVSDSGVRGFFLSEERSDWDTDARTSEGIFVRTNDPSGLTVGETVKLSAFVMEFQSFQNLPRTFLVNPTIVSQSNVPTELPTVVLEGAFAIPNSILSDDSPDFRDAFDDAGDTFDPANDALDFFETVEGMRVTLRDAVVADGEVGLSGGDARFKAYSALTADADQINSRGGYTVAGDPPNSPPDTIDPDDGTLAGGRHVHDGDANPDIVELDFSGPGIGGTSGFHKLITMGDRLGDVSGVIDFDFAEVKLYVTEALDPAKVAGLGAAPALETVEFAADPRALRVATFNVENLNPQDAQAKFDALAQTIKTNLGRPDIISIEEIQDNNGPASGGVDAGLTWQKLVDALNLATGERYQWVDQDPGDRQDGGAANANIRVGFLYNTNRVQLGDLAADATLAERRQFTDRIGDGLRDAGDRIAVSDNMLGGEIATADWTTTRKSLLGEFTFNGNTVYVTANHWPSKLGSGDFWQLNQNIGAGQPANSDWDQRNAIANDLYAMMDLITTQSGGGARVVAAGDFNEFYYNRPMEVVTGHVTVDGAARVGGPRFENLTLTLPEAERYTYVFDGRSQAIDHIVVDQALAGVARYDVVHVNTGFNTQDPENNPAVSDHEPAVAQFDFRSFAEKLSGGAAADLLQGFGGADTLMGAGGDDTLAGGAADDRLEGGAGVDLAVFSGARADYAVERTADGARVTDLRAGAPDGVDQLVGVERLAFTDGSRLLRELLNRAPQGEADAFTVVEDAATPLDVLFNDTDPDSVLGDESKTLVTVSGAASGASVRIENNKVLYTADADAFDLLAPGETALDTFTYTFRDAFGGVGEATVTVTVREGGDNVALAGSNKAETLQGTDKDETIRAGNGADTVIGAGGADVLFGENGDDSLMGGAGRDSLFGDTGADTLLGEAGDDLLAGGQGEDRLFGGLGADVFVFGKTGGTDVVVDFDPVLDQLRFEDGLTLQGVTLQDVDGDGSVDALLQLAGFGAGRVVVLGGGSIADWPIG